MKKKYLALLTALIFLTPATLQAMTEDQEDIKAFEQMFPADEPTEEDFYKQDRLLLTATGSLKPVRLAPSVASVITKEDIEEMGLTTLDEVLETVPGLHVVPSNYNRLNSNFSIRGISTKMNPQVLLLMNGTPVRYILNGNRPQTFNLPIANISRVEVIRGPGSALHGADAFAGIINVITKDGQEIDGTVTGMRAGSFGTTDTWLQHGGNYSGWDVALSLEYLRSDGDTDRIIERDLQTTLDGALNTPFGLPPASYAPGPLETDDRILDVHLGLAKDNWDLGLWGWLQDDAGLGAGIAQILDPVGNQNTDYFSGELNYNNAELVKDWDFSFKLAYSHLEDDPFLVLMPSGALVPIGADGNIDFVNTAGLTYFPNGVIGAPSVKEEQRALDLNAFYEGFNHHRFLIGAGYKHLSLEAEESKNFGPGILDGSQPVADGTLTNVTGTTNIFIQDTTREVWHALFQDEWSFARNWELTAGVRYDHYSDFGDTLNPRLALVWQTRYDLTSKLLYGRAFRPPSFGENYMTNNPSALGNPDLDPETIDTIELAFDYQPTNRLRTHVNLFYYEIDDLIEYLPDAGQSTSTAQNSKDQKGHGFEIDAIWDITDTFKLRGNFAYQRSKDDDTDEIVPDTPEMQLYLNPHWKFATDWALDGQYYWIADRHRADGDTRDDVKNNDIVNVTLRKKNILINHLDGALAVRNLFEEDVREPSTAVIPNDYPMETRAIWAELRYKF